MPTFYLHKNAQCDKIRLRKIDEGGQKMKKGLLITTMAVTLMVFATMGSGEPSAVIQPLKDIPYIHL